MKKQKEQQGFQSEGYLFQQSQNAGSLDEGKNGSDKYFRA